VGWPARSPDLSTCDFFLWGYVEKMVFKHRPRALEDLKEQVAEEISAHIPIEMCRKVSENVSVRLQQRIAADGRRLSDIIFLTHGQM